MSKHILLVLAGAFLCAAACSAGEDACAVHLKGGRVLRGELLGEEEGVVRLRTAAGEELALARTLVRSVERGGVPDIFSVRCEGPTGEGEGADPGFIRYRPPSGDAAGALETAVQRLHDPKGNNDVFLVSVVHIGEPAYFRRLQDVLDSMDVVLFEGVRGGFDPAAPAGEDRTATLDAIIKLQLLLKDALGFAYQKDVVDYDRAFWVNSDMAWSEVQARLDEQGLALIPNEKLVALAGNLLAGFVRPGRTISAEQAMRIRRMVAPLLGNAERLLAGLKGFEGLDRVAIQARNDVVVRDLGTWLEKSRARRIAIFYGAGHMRDLKAKARERYGLDDWGSAWFKAWRVE